MSDKPKSALDMSPSEFKAGLAEITRNLAKAEAKRAHARFMKKLADHAASTTTVLTKKPVP